jgi:hypothetical protein
MILFARAVEMVRAKVRSFGGPVFSVLGLIGFACAGLSVAALVWRALTLGVSSAMRVLMDYYDGILTVLLGWARPYVSSLVEFVGQWIAIDLDLHDHWKHVFVLIGVYFFRDATETLKVGRPVSALFLLVIGFVIALFSAAGSGSIAPVADDYWAQFWIAAIPVIGVTLYDFLKLLQYTFFLRKWVAERTGEKYAEAWPYFVARIHYVARIPPFGLGVAALGALLPLQYAGLATLLFLVVVLTLYWIRTGALRVPKVRKPGETWWQAFYGTGPGLLGAAMAGVLISAMAYLLTNAGLKLAGL